MNGDYGCVSEYNRLHGYLWLGVSGQTQAKGTFACPIFWMSSHQVFSVREVISDGHNVYQLPVPAFVRS